jgi:hypothetical protein
MPNFFWSNLATIARQLWSVTSFFVHGVGPTFNPPLQHMTGHPVLNI